MWGNSHDTKTNNRDWQNKNVQNWLIRTRILGVWGHSHDTKTNNRDWLNKSVKNWLNK